MNLALASKYALCTLLLLFVVACSSQSEREAPPAENGAATLTTNVFQVLAYDPDLAFAQWDALPSGGATLAMTSLDGEELAGPNYIGLTSGLHEVGYHYEVTLSCDANGYCETRTGSGILRAMFAAGEQYDLRLVCHAGALFVVVVGANHGDSKPVAESRALEDYGICDDLTTQLG